MIYPDTPRLTRKSAGYFFTQHIRPRLPEAVAMGTDSAPRNILDRRPDANDKDTISSNARTLMILSFRRQ